jgi:hypothetical protein
LIKTENFICCLKLIDYIIIRKNDHNLIKKLKLWENSTDFARVAECQWIRTLKKEGQTLMGQNHSSFAAIVLQQENLMTVLKKREKWLVSAKAS